MKGTGIIYSAAERAWIKANAKRPRREAWADFCRQFDRHDVSLTNFTSLCKRNGWRTGRDGRFEAGAASWNKGQKMPFNPASAATQFKKGHLPPNVKYLGHERMSGDGYVEISIAEKNPHTGALRRYVHKHRWLWEKQHGPVPEGFVLKCLDADKTNCDPANWELIPRALLPRLNGRFGRDYDTAPDDLKPVIMTISKLEHEVRQKKASRQKKMTRPRES